MLDDIEYTPLSFVQPVLSIILRKNNLRLVVYENWSHVLLPSFPRLSRNLKIMSQNNINILPRSEILFLVTHTDRNEPLSFFEWH